MTVIMVLLAGVFGVIAGWHWKLMHHSWQDARAAIWRARSRVPALRVARSRNTGKAFWYAIAAIALVFLIAKVR